MYSVLEYKVSSRITAKLRNCYHIGFERNKLTNKLKYKSLDDFILTEIPYESFVLQDVMSVDKLYKKFRKFLNLFEITTPSTGSLGDIFVLRVLIALYGATKGDEMLGVFRERRKIMGNSTLSDIELYGPEEPI